MAEFQDPNIIFRTEQEDPQNTLLVGMSLLKESMLAVGQLSDARPVDKYTINNGIIYPKTGYIRVDTEGQSPQDDLEALDIADTHDGMIVYLQAFSSSRTVTLKKNAGVNGIDIPADVTLPSDPYSWIRLKRNGQNWQQVQEFIKSVYELCEFYFFRSPILRPGFQPAQGGIISNAAKHYPEAWRYLQSAEGKILCKTEEEWQEMTRAVWHTCADGTQIGWNGIGGAPFYAPDTVTGALRLPDLRGMYVEAAGFDSLGVGGVHGDAIKGGLNGIANFVISSGAYSTGVFSLESTPWGVVPASNASEKLWRLHFNSSRVVPTANKNQPRAWGALACVYLGRIPNK